MKKVGIISKTSCLYESRQEAAGYKEVNTPEILDRAIMGKIWPLGKIWRTYVYLSNT